MVLRFVDLLKQGLCPCVAQAGQELESPPASASRITRLLYHAHISGFVALSGLFPATALSHRDSELFPVA